MDGGGGVWSGVEDGELYSQAVHSLCKQMANGEVWTRALEALAAWWALKVKCNRHTGWGG